MNAKKVSLDCKEKTSSTRIVIHFWKLIRVFPKVDHSANVAKIVLVEYTIGSIVELNIC